MGIARVQRRVLPRGYTFLATVVEWLVLCAYMCVTCAVACGVVLTSGPSVAASAAVATSGVTSGVTSSGVASAKDADSPNVSSSCTCCSPPARSPRWLWAAAADGVPAELRRGGSELRRGGSEIRRGGSEVRRDRSAESSEGAELKRDSSSAPTGTPRGGACACARGMAVLCGALCHGRAVWSSVVWPCCVELSLWPGLGLVRT